MEAYFQIAAQDPAQPFSKDVLGLFLSARDFNKKVFDTVEGTAFTEPKVWHKGPEEGELQGGGIMTVGRGEILEKCAVNMSYVWGSRYPQIESQHANKPFTATGVSLICHPKNPNAPIAHMNIRVLKVGRGEDSQTWIGGGADLTPMVKFADDTQDFHNALKAACDETRFASKYQSYKKWCDEYFYIPHRKEIRGIGGIFFDYVNVEQTSDFEFLFKVATNFGAVYQTILERRKNLPYTDSDVKKHHFWRARYAEFNLIYDRGTRFGLLSGGNTEAILCSMPPVVCW